MESVKKTTLRLPSSDGKSILNVLVWEPPAPMPRKGIIQIVHGMVEFLDRYDRWARELARAGYVVAGDDHIGHGESCDPDDWGKMPYADGARVLVDDEHALRTLIRAGYGSDLPYFIYGHSMGSFITRAYLADDRAAGLAGAIIQGTGNIPVRLSRAGLALIGALNAVHGPDYRSDLVTNMVIGDFNKPFHPARTRADWISRDEGVCDAYVADPRCDFVFSLGAYRALLTLTSSVVLPSTACRVDADLPILVMSGTMDPVGDFGRGVTAAAELLRDAGVKDVTLKLYPDCRHELHNELNKDEVLADVLAWLDTRLPR